VIKYCDKETKTRFSLLYQDEKEYEECDGDFADKQYREIEHAVLQLKSLLL